MAGEDWRDITLGEFVRLQRGHDLPATNCRAGTVPVMGSAGQNGFHDTSRAKGPGVTIGRSGVGSMGVAMDITGAVTNAVKFVSQRVYSHAQYCNFQPR